MATLKLSETALISRRAKLTGNAMEPVEKPAQPPNPGKSFKGIPAPAPKQAAEKLAKPTKPKRQAAPIKIFHSNRPEIIIDGYRSLYWYSNHLGLHMNMVDLHRLGFIAGEICKARDIQTGLKHQEEIYPGGWIHSTMVY